MRMPNWTKPIHWYVVGPVFRNFYHSHAENFCFGALLILCATATMPLVAMITASELMAYTIAGGVCLWGIAHMIAGAVMVIREEKRIAARKANSKKTSN
tara:strand:+ start:57 stop:353 length:297 start_codon:yes stop_codon:yes gene_type:complete